MVYVLYIFKDNFIHFDVVFNSKEKHDFKILRLIFKLYSNVFEVILKIIKIFLNFQEEPILVENLILNCLLLKNKNF